MRISDNEYSLYLLKFQNLKQEYINIESTVGIPIEIFNKIAYKICEEIMELNFQEFLSPSEEDDCLSDQNKETLLKQKDVDLHKLKEIFSQL